MAGNVGARERVGYTAIGDTTNTAARLEGMTKGSAYTLFISGATRELMRRPARRPRARRRVRDPRTDGEDRDLLDRRAARHAAAEADVGRRARPRRSGPAVAFPVAAPGPAAGRAHPVLQLLLRSADPALARGLLLGVLHPADELVASQRRDAPSRHRAPSRWRPAPCAGPRAACARPSGNPLAAHEPNERRRLNPRAPRGPPRGPPRSAASIWWNSSRPTPSARGLIIRSAWRAGRLGGVRAAEQQHARERLAEARGRGRAGRPVRRVLRAGAAPRRAAEASPSRRPR